MGDLDNSFFGEYDFYLLTRQEVKQAAGIIAAMGYMVGEVNLDACRVSVKIGSDATEDMKKVRAALEKA
jgi:hypothetical protein